MSDEEESREENGESITISLTRLLKREETSLQEKNSTLERESEGCSSVLIYSSLFIGLDLFKQISTYGMKYYNNNVYPRPQTEVVAVTEFMKFVIFAGLCVHYGYVTRIKISFWYAVPSIIYAFNNNIYYWALHYATPPIWNILIQQRIVFTALIYRVLFKREISKVQWLALGLLVAAIVASNFSGGQVIGGTSNLIVALVLALVGSITSSLAAICMEYLFKNDNKTFVEMQTQLYLFSSIFTFIFVWIERAETTQKEWTGDANLLQFLILSCIVLSCVCGITVAAIIKKLDNIVKLYTQALSNMLTSVACTMLFPDHFNVNLYFLLCLLVMFVAIFLYENKKIDWDALVARGRWLLKGREMLSSGYARSFLCFVVVVFLCIWGFRSGVLERVKGRLRT